MFTQIKETYGTLRKLFKTDGNPSVVERGVMPDVPIFEVLNSEGKRIQIWKDGRIAGMPGDYTIVINRIYPLIDKYEALLREKA